MTDFLGRRISLLRQKMKEVNVDLVAFGPGAHMQWLLGFHTHPDERPCLLLVGPETESFLMPALNADEARKQTTINMHVWEDADGCTSALESALAEASVPETRRISIDETMRVDFAFPLQRAMPDAEFEFMERTVSSLRMIKDEQECSVLRENAAIADRCMDVAMDAISPGISEFELAGLVSKTFADQGAVMQFAVIGSGPNGALPHHSAGKRKIQHGDVVVVDIGGRMGGFNSDITRVAVLGDKPTDFVKVHAIVENAVKAALDAARPGNLARDVDLAARGVIDEAGFGEYFVHRTGHGLGIEVHEPPYMMSSSSQVLEEGMVFSIEPGIYLPNRFGVRLEEIVILGKDGPEILSRHSRMYRSC